MKKSEDIIRFGENILEIGLLVAFIIREKKILKGINLTNIAQERYFYELEVFLKEEELVLYHLIKY